MAAGPLFPSSVVGSMPRSDFVKELIADETIAPDDYARAMVQPFATSSPSRNGPGSTW